MEIQSKDGFVWLIQVFHNGFKNKPTLTYRLKSYEAANSMITVVDPKLGLTKSFPTTICSVDEVKQ